jgi:predicted hotdog family 3-hydroxylacyl-ACP dehydratase
MSMPPLPREDWQHLLPHAGAMCLLERVLAWDAQSIQAQGGDPADAGHPLRGVAGLHAVHLIEYGAQAMALHAALQARARGDEPQRSGLLVSLRDVTLAVEIVSKGRLDVQANCLYADVGGAQYTFSVLQEGRELAGGRAAVIHAAR